jgi:hypothetical protein
MDSLEEFMRAYNEAQDKAARKKNTNNAPPNLETLRESAIDFAEGRNRGRTVLRKPRNQKEAVAQRAALEFVTRLRRRRNEQ